MGVQAVSKGRVAERAGQYQLPVSNTRGIHARRQRGRVLQTYSLYWDPLLGTSQRNRQQSLFSWAEFMAAPATRHELADLVDGSPM
jgi:hypothetical protein